MVFLGNSASFHLVSWLRIYARLGYEKLNLATVHEIASSEDSFGYKIQVNNPFKVFAYALLGWKLRFERFDWLHAHGASGYGLAALLSGRPYIVTIYGSEVLGKHGVAYRGMIRTILSRARFVTVTSEATRVALIREFKVKYQKIRCFHTGIDVEYIDRFNAGQNYSRGDVKNVLAIRNTGEVYRTEELINACENLRNSGLKIHLTIVLGNGNLQYFDRIRLAYNYAWIDYIRRRVENDEMLEMMAASDVCVSYPKSDQLSSSVLEALCLGRPVVIAPLEAYKELTQSISHQYGLYIAHDGELDATIRKSLAQGAPSNPRQLVREKYGVDQAVGHFSKIMSHIYD